MPTVSIAAAQSRAGIPVATTALSSRAPSMWVRSPRECASAATAPTCSNGQILPPPALQVFSIDTIAERG
jgi:hypothetical protein